MKEKVEIVMLEYLHATVSQDAEAIKEGDFYIHMQNGDGLRVRKCIGGNLPMDSRKIITTNDPKLLTKCTDGFCIGSHGGNCSLCKYVPQLSLSSIKEYISNPDGLFEVEYEHICCEKYTSCNSNCTTKGFKLKLNQDNKVDITSVEKKMYSEEEVEGILYQYAEDEHGWFSSKSEIESFNNWIKENL